MGTGFSSIIRINKALKYSFGHSIAKQFYASYANGKNHISIENSRIKLYNEKSEKK